MNTIRPLLCRTVLDSPWAVVRQFHDDLQRVFSDLDSEVSVGHPPVNVWYNDSKAVVTVELPGVKKEDIDVSVTGNALTLKGSRNIPEFEGAKLLRRGRSSGNFGRNMILPFDIEVNGVEANLKEGILTLTLPRKKEEVPKKLEIKTH